MRLAYSTVLVLALSCVTSASRAQHLDTIPLYSLVLEVRTASSSNSGTDDRVVLDTGFGGLVLNRGRDERNTGDIDTWDILPAAAGTSTGPGVIRGSSFQSLTFSKSGSNGWRISEVNIYANGGFTPVYHWEGTQLIDTPTGNTFTLPPLRANRAWDGTQLVQSRWTTAGSIAGVNVAPMQIGGEALWLFHDSLMGDLFDAPAWMSSDLRWGGLDGSSYVVVDGGQAVNEWHVDLDAEHWTGTTGSWREADIDYRYSVSCSGSRYVVGLVASNCDTWGTPHVKGLCDQAALAHGQRSLPAVQRIFDAVNALGRACSVVSVNSDGSVRFF